MIFRTCARFFYLVMLSKEEVADVISYCKEHGCSYKERLAELGIPEWKFYDS